MRRVLLGHLIACALVLPAAEPVTAVPPLPCVTEPPAPRQEVRASVPAQTANQSSRHLLILECPLFREGAFCQVLPPDTGQGRADRAPMPQLDVETAQNTL